MAENKETKERICHIVEDQPRGSVVHCENAVLATQIKKLAPSVNVISGKSSVSMEIQRASISSRSKVSMERMGSMLKSASSVRQSTTTLPDIVITEKPLENENFDEVAVRKIPVGMDEKRRRNAQVRSKISLDLGKPGPCKKFQGFCVRVWYTFRQYEMWDDSLKVIEGRFGTATLSYFLFLRWLLVMNIILLLLNFFFLILPLAVLQTMHVGLVNNETLVSKIDDYLEEEYTNATIDNTKSLLSTLHVPKTVNISDIEGIVELCQSKYEREIKKAKQPGVATSIQNFLQGTGFLEPTPLFLGHYPSDDKSLLGLKYSFRMAFLWVFIISFIYCFVKMIKYQSVGIKDALITKYHSSTFTNLCFPAWNFCVRTSDAAFLCQMDITNHLKSNLNESRRKQALGEIPNAVLTKLFVIRVIINIIVFAWIAVCFVGIYLSTQYQLQEMTSERLVASGSRKFMIEYLPQFILVVIDASSPGLFMFLTSFEKFYQRQEVNVALVRHAFLSITSVLVLVQSFHQSITCIPKDICGMGASASCRAPRCWETYVGQELYKLSISQLFSIITVFVIVDIPRTYIVRRFSNTFTRLIGLPVFFLPTEILVPVYAQTILWLGVFYSPLLPVLAVLKITVLFYVKKAKVLKYSQPATALYQSSRFNAYFINILLWSFISIIAVHLYTIIKIRPSLGCSPFRYYGSMVDALKYAMSFLPFDLLGFFAFVFSGWFFVPATLLMSCIIYYYWKYIGVLKDLEESLKSDLVMLTKDKHYLLQKIEILAKKND